MLPFQELVAKLKRTEKIKSWFSGVMIYLSISGLITFSLFIHEEAIQSCQFGSWPAKSVGEWGIVLQGTDLMRKINMSAKIINYSIGWIQPLAFFSYRAYSKSVDYYVHGQESQIFANAPELFIGRKVNFTFHPKRVESLSNGKYLLTNGKIGILYSNMPALKKQAIMGILEEQDKYLIVNMQE